MKKYLDFSQEFGKIDEELIAEAGKPWTIKRGDVFRLYRRKIGQAAAILLAFITVINQVQTKNGISLTINEVILDNYSLIVSVKPDYEEKKEDSLYLWIDDENGKNANQAIRWTGPNSSKGFDLPAEKDFYGITPGRNTRYEIIQI